jgi:hypothetical protein
MNRRDVVREEDRQTPALERKRKQLRLYLIGFSEAAWEILSEPLYTRYPLVEVHFETALTRDVGLVLALLVEVEDLDPDFFNTLRNEKRIAWWEYSRHPPNTRWLYPEQHRTFTPDD